MACCGKHQHDKKQSENVAVKEEQHDHCQHEKEHGNHQHKHEGCQCHK